ncbi:MAG: tRNA pseudouridine(13) synthase TruD [Gammaproteobacteria bacterium]|nr:tRNA pseudouridine(13) synthase TruD [Gammaproteobacteria bacterium]MDP2349283.1 tRNA pseudouridine(13) synthase TruD [Gammaproteobacteria bacterium]
MSLAREEIAALAFAYGAPEYSAVFKREPADFCVDEDLGFELSGTGDHLCMQIRKTGVATPQVVRMLERAAGVREVDIGYAGLKDRQGVCVQWFSIHLPGKDDPEIGGAGIEVLQSVRNSRKIRRGSHRGNHFRIRLRDFQATVANLEQNLVARLQLIAARGVPNYFGEQRFGIDNCNVAMATQMFAGELRVARGFKRGMLLSAARSQVFNALLSQRVAAQNWDRYLQGDVMNLNGSDSVFVPLQWDAVLQERLERFDIHPTGPLWGAGELRSGGDAAELELLCKEQHEVLCKGLERAGLQQARRSLRLPVEDLQWTLTENGELELVFMLPPGTYATSVLRELVRLS